MGNRRELAAINPLLKNSPGKYQKYQLEGRLRENTTLKPKKGPTMGNWASKGEDVKLCESRRWHVKNALNVFLSFPLGKARMVPIWDRPEENTGFRRLTRSVGENRPFRRS